MPGDRLIGYKDCIFDRRHYFIHTLIGIISILGNDVN